jgi:fluoride ion exporter CrcB/FEX
MARTTIIFGVLLIGVSLGVIAYNGGFQSITVLIPSFIGAIIAICGLLALDEKKRKHAMHAAVLVGLLGGLACIGQGSAQLMKLGTDKAPSIDKLASVWTTGALCVVFVGLCIQSFIAARKQREAA